MADVDSKLDQLLALVPAVTALQETINGMQGNIAASTAAVQKIEGVAAETKVIQKEVEKQGKAIEEMNKRLSKVEAGESSAPRAGSKRPHVDPGQHENASPNDTTVKLSGMKDNLDRDEKLDIAKKVLADPGEGDADIDFRVYGKFGKEIYLKFANASTANVFYERRTAKTAAKPMYATLEGKQERLWWNCLESPEN